MIEKGGDFLGFNKQQVRIIDIFIISPFLFYTATKTNDKFIKYSLFGLSTMTLLYNGYYFIQNKI